MNNKKILGHEFLARLGKKRLRPGGINGTKYLYNSIQKHFISTTDIKILEVSCNRGYSLVELGKTFDSEIYGIDVDNKALSIAQSNINKNNLTNKVKIFNMNAMNIEFENIKFDVIINEAMLTMYKDKDIFLKQYIANLKDDGILLTHDICVVNNSFNKQINDEMKDVINLKPYPLTIEDWISTFEKNGLKVIDYKIFNFSLTTIKGLIKDEGFFNMIKIIKNALKKNNKKQFFAMKKYFSQNKDNLKAICFVLKKQ